MLIGHMEKLLFQMQLSNVKPGSVTFASIRHRESSKGWSGRPSKCSLKMVLYWMILFYECS